MFYESDTEHVAPIRRTSATKLSFTYNAGEVTLDEHSARTKLCCPSASLFRVYHRDTSELLPRGICCVQCDTEYLDREEYPEGDYESEGVEVHCVEMASEFECSTDDVCNVNRKTFVFYRKVHISVKLPPCTPILTMVNPNRKYINHRDPGEIERLRPGTHVMWHRPYTLWHHQLVKQNRGGGKCDVIHFDVGKRGGRGKAEVQEIEEYDFTVQDNGTAYEIDYDESIENSNPLKLIMDRAYSQLMENNYCLFRNNCEHMVTFCKTGSRQSLQINWLHVKVLLLLIRVLFLLAVIVIVSKIISLCQKSISEVEEWVELFAVLVIEIIFVIAIALFWLKLHKRGQVMFTDCWRRIIESLFELVLTVLFYMIHVLIFSSMEEDERICYDSFVVEHIFSGIGFGIGGKIAGCIIGQASAQCMLTPGPEFGIPSSNFGQYGRVGYAALVNV